MLDTDPQKGKITQEGLPKRTRRLSEWGFGRPWQPLAMWVFDLGAVWFQIPEPACDDGLIDNHLVQSRPSRTIFPRLAQS